MNRFRHIREEDRTKNAVDEEHLIEAMLTDNINGHLSNLFVYVKLEIESLIEETIKINNSQIMDLGIKQDYIARNLAKVEAYKAVLEMPDTADTRLQKILDDREES